MQPPNSAANAINPMTPRIATSRSLLFNSQIVNEIRMILPPVGVVLPRLPQLAADVDVPIPIHVPHHRLMPAQPVVQYHALDEVRPLPIHVLPDVPPRRPHA